MVNILLRFAFALILFYAVAGQLIEGPVQLPSVFATNGNVMHSTFNGSTYNAAGGNYIVVQDQIYDGSSRIIVFIRDQGTYATRRAQQQPWPRWAEIMSTNGNWIGTLDENGVVDTFQVNSTNSFVNITSFSSSARFIQFLSDDTLVLIDQSSIDTYEYFEGNWTKILHQNVSFLVNPYLTRTVERANDSVPHLTDTTLAAFNPVRRVVELYTRSADKSWTLVDEISIDPQYHVSRIIWNGDDTVIVSDIIYMIRDPDTLQNDVGRILIHQKNGGSWNLTNIIYNADVTTNPGYLGFSMLLINRDLIAISAPFDQGTGTVFYLQRRPGIEWQFTTQFFGDYRLNFGFSLMRTDYDVVIQSGGRANASPLPNARQTLIPPCYLPIQHQCQNVTTDTCQPFDVSHDELYTVGDPCTVVTLENIQFNGDSSTLAFSFSRLTGEFETLYCNSTIACTNPPTTLINPSDPNSNVPASPSAQSSSPISIVPVASPSEGGRRRTSNSPLLWLDIAAIGCAAIVSLV